MFLEFMMKDNRHFFSFLVAFFYFIISAPAISQMGATVSENGIFMGISTYQIIQVKIKDNLERVCLPKIEFEDDVDKQEVMRNLKDIPVQDAIFRLYHDGLGRPKKQNGMYYASDVYLKGMKQSYTAYLKKTYRATISKKPGYEEKDIVLDQHGNKTEKSRLRKIKEKKVNSPRKRLQPSNMRVTTIYDVLPENVIHPRLRKIEKEIARKVSELKNRPYKAEIIQIDPLRWAAGRMGLLREDGLISGANVEGQKPELFISSPDKDNWLTSEMISELSGQPCEFVIHRYKNGLEVFENNRYYLRDIYFSKLKISWVEWLKKHNIEYLEPELQAGFADKAILLDVKLVSGHFERLGALVLCSITFSKENSLVKTKELFRVFPPSLRPKNFASFAKILNRVLNNKQADVSMLMCKDAKPYRELGQIRARRIYFPELKATLSMIQNQILTGKLK